MRLHKVASVIAGVLAIFLPASRVRAQAVSIAPQVIVIDGANRTSSITLINPSDAPTDIVMSTTYGYPITDVNGTMTLRTFATLSDTAPSAAGWVQFFPRRLRLAPHARRTVRLLITPPDSIGAHEYWGRLIVAASGAPVIVRNASAGDNIRLGLNLTVRSVLPVFFRPGAVTTGVHMSGARSTQVADSLFARVKLERTGTAAFLGMLGVSLRDESGRTIRHAELPIGVYYTLDPVVVIPVSGVPSGRYQLVFDVATGRADVAPNLVVPGTSARSSVAITIP